jgi:hypothetical protein
MGKRANQRRCRQMPVAEVDIFGRKRYVTDMEKSNRKGEARSS